MRSIQRFWVLVFVCIPFQAANADDPPPTVKPQSTSEIRAAKSDYKPYRPLADASSEIAGPLGNLDQSARYFGILKSVDTESRRVSLLLDGDAETSDWPVRPDAEVWHDGWWGRLNEFTLGDRVWVWFDTDRSKQRTTLSLLADELSEQNLYAPVKIKALDFSTLNQARMTLETIRVGKPVLRTVNLAQAETYQGERTISHESLKVGDAVHVQTTGDNARLILDPTAFEQRRAAQQAATRRQWTDEGLPGTLIFGHAEAREVELMLDHEAMRWSREMQPGDQVSLRAAKSIPAVVRRLRPWREQTQVVVQVADSDVSECTAGQRVTLRLTNPPNSDQESLPPGLGKSQSKPERLQWLVSGVYCTCGMHDGCAGHCFTLGACISSGSKPCGLAKRTREEIGELIDKGRTDRDIFDTLLKPRGPNVRRPHMSP